VRRPRPRRPGRRTAPPAGRRTGSSAAIPGRHRVRGAAGHLLPDALGRLRCRQRRARVFDRGQALGLRRRDHVGDPRCSSRLRSSALPEFSSAARRSPLVSPANFTFSASAVLREVLERGLLLLQRRLRELGLLGHPLRVVEQPIELTIRVERPLPDLAQLALLGALRREVDLLLLQLLAERLDLVGELRALRHPLCLDRAELGLVRTAQRLRVHADQVAGHVRADPRAGRDLVERALRAQDAALGELADRAGAGADATAEQRVARQHGRDPLGGQRVIRQRELADALAEALEPALDAVAGRAASQLGASEPARPRPSSRCEPIYFVPSSAITRPVLSTSLLPSQCGASPVA
jgi:hypothetical protein